MGDRVVVVHEHDTPIPVASEPGTLIVVREPADTMIVREQQVALTVPAEAPPTVVVREQAPTVLAIASPAQGPAGPPGPSGGEDGQPRYAGEGPPPQVIVGAHPGDAYLDTLTGNLWRLT